MKICIPITGPMPHTPAWYSLRTFEKDRSPAVTFGASEAAALCGISDYQSTYELYLRKRGLIVEDEDNEYKQFGRALEGVILREYARREGVTLFGQCPMYFHGEYKFLSATPDEMGCREDARRKFPIDAKNTNARRFKLQFGQEWSDELPMDILMQAQQQMLVMGCDMQETAVLVGGNNLKVFRVPRRDDLCEAIVEAGLEMYDPDFSHPGIVNCMKKAFKINSADCCYFGDDVFEKWQAYQKFGAQIKELEAEQDTIKAEILHRMGEAAVARFADGDIELVRAPRHRSSYTVKACDYTVLTQRKVNHK
jgi:hypothetical protein